MVTADLFITSVTELFTRDDSNYQERNRPEGTRVEVAADLFITSATELFTRDDSNYQ